MVLIGLFSNFPLLSQVTMSTRFVDVVPIRQITTHSYAIDLGDEWCIGNGMSISQSFVNITFLLGRS